MADRRGIGADGGTTTTTGLVGERRMCWKCYLGGLLAILVWAATGGAAPPHSPTGLLCELNPEPLGIEAATPAFSWIVNDPRPDAMQLAHQIVVRRGSGASQVLVWDSGPVASSQSIAVPYAGPPLIPGQMYWWTVRTWDRAGGVSPYAEPQLFVTALKDTWTAKPIWGATDDTFVFLRGTFELPDKPIHKALAFVSGRDCDPTRQYVFRCYINEQPVGVGPARGFGGRVPYNVFDVTEAVAVNRPNVLAAICCSTGEAKEFIAELRVFFQDGSDFTFGTSETWRAMSADRHYNMGSPFTRYYQAGPEHLDARHWPAGWLSAGFNDHRWQPARTLDLNTERWFAQPHRSVRIREVEPIRVQAKAKGHYFFDFGKEIVGCVKLAVTGREGERLELRLGEELDAPDTVRHAARTGVTYCETWTLREGKQTLENFGYRAFRYGELLNMPDGEFTLSVTTLEYPFDESAAAFHSADEILNEVWALCHYTIQATSLDVYQDCPTRERGPYEGDAYINMLSHYAADREFAMARYSNEYLYDRGTWPTEYGPMCVLMAWADYMATGDHQSLARHYDALVAKTLLIHTNGEGLIEKHDTRDNRVLIDWPPPYRDGYEFTPINTVVNCFHYRSVALLSRIAGILGKRDDEAYYQAAADRAQRAIRENLFDATAGVYRDGRDSDHSSAHANFFPLALSVTPAEHRASVGQSLVEKGMACSVYGAQFMLEALYEAGRADAALRLMTATDVHSWHHMIYNLGATMTTEAWDPAGKSNMSYAHPWATAPLNIVPRRLFGIEPVEAGYAAIRIRPQTGGLAWATLTLPTIRGPIQASFRDSAPVFELDVSLPATMTATVYVPVRNSDQPTVLVDGHPVAAARSDEYWVITGVGSGTRRFESR